MIPKRPQWHKSSPTSKLWTLEFFNGNLRATILESSEDPTHSTLYVMGTQLSQGALPYLQSLGELHLRKLLLDALSRLCQLPTLTPEDINALINYTSLISSLNLSSNSHIDACLHFLVNLISPTSVDWGIIGGASPSLTPPPPKPMPQPTLPSPTSPQGPSTKDSWDSLCPHDHLNEDGICRQCNHDCRGSH